MSIIYYYRGGGSKAWYCCKATQCYRRGHLITYSFDSSHYTESGLLMWLISLHWVWLTHVTHLTTLSQAYSCDSSHYTESGLPMWPISQHWIWGRIIKTLVKLQYSAPSISSYNMKATICQQCCKSGSSKIYKFIVGRLYLSLRRAHCSQHMATYNM